MNRFVAMALIGAALSATCVTSASAVTLPYTEDFSVDNANWGGSTATSLVFAAPTYVSTGGPLGAGDAYISTPKVCSSTPLGQVTFRGQGNFDSSGDAFVGDWIARNVTELSFWIRQQSNTTLHVGTRFAGAGNNPGANIMYQTPIQPNVWTLITMPISSTSTPDFVYTDEGGSFNFVFSSLSNVQILVQKDDLETGTTVTIDVDKISIVPEPSSVVLVGMGLAIAGVAAFRRRRSAK